MFFIKLSSIKELSSSARLPGFPLRQLKSCLCSRWVLEGLIFLRSKWPSGQFWHKNRHCRACAKAWSGSRAGIDLLPQVPLLCWHRGTRTNCQTPGPPPSHGHYRCHRGALLEPSQVWKALSDFPLPGSGERLQRVPAEGLLLFTALLAASAPGEPSCHDPHSKWGGHGCSALAA